ncbi:DUF2018 family protein [Helicobacter anatolicus]|uniref:DUF2018 family protein n=1 Tax=Helicobacter anatolicus TaxID=2905874 RepID=UPI001E41FF57|nr:DUF2018 family protein [Helicobacter anatolicus]MCE3039604.1 DUF2018 family protein [Helicobacter anatolicus]
MWEDLEVLQGNPVQKWQDIVFHANRSLVQKQLENLLERLALCETLIHEEGLEDKLLEKARILHFDEDLQQDIGNKKADLAIESMAKILSENE